MTRDNRQILVNPHSSQEKIPAGALNLGEIGVQHNNVEDAALYVETVADSQSAGTVAKFITEKAIDNKIENAIDILENEIDGINEAVGLPHEESGATPWGSASTVWNAIETVYNEMTAGTAAANTKLVTASTQDTADYMTLTAQTDAATSSITYTIGLKGIKDALDGVKDLLGDEIEELSAVTTEELDKLNDRIDDLDFAGVPQEGKPIVNVTQEDGLVNAEAGRIDSEYIDYDSAHTLDQILETIMENIEANEVECSDGSIIVDNSGEKTDIKVNIDKESIVLNDNNELVADLMLSSITPSSVNVREEFALINSVGAQLGDTIKVYKDSSLYSAFLGHMGDILSDPTNPGSLVENPSGDTALDLIYHMEDGTYQLVTIDVNDFLEESEFKDGLVVDNHVVKVLVDPASEKVETASGVSEDVLSVSENGVKIANIQKAIDYAVSELAKNVNADVTGTSSDGHVSVEVVQENTELTQVIVSTDDIASAEELDKVEESVGLNEDGSFSADPTSNYASAATSVRNEIKLIDSALKEISDKLNGVSVEKSADSVENFVTLAVTDDGEGATALTINDAELKQTIDFINDDISSEIAAREEADAALLGTSASTSDEPSIWGVKNLVEELDTDNVQEIGFAPVATKDETVYGSNAGAEIVDGDNGKKINLDLSYLKIDCGEY